MPKRAGQANLYLQRINAVTDYARAHLYEDLSLDTLARVAGFSPFHFHRVFKALTEETLNEMVLRLRLERAATLLRSGPNLSLTDAAFESGFQSVAFFSRAFKKHFGVNASRWDRRRALKNSKNGQVFGDPPRYTLENLGDSGDYEKFEVRLRSLPAQRLAYIRVFDSYSPGSGIVEAYQRLLAWYERRGGRLDQTTLYGMSQDNPDVTPRKLCRFDWCLRVPPGWTAEGEVNVLDFPACRVAQIRMQGDANLEGRMLEYLFCHWLPRSRYQPANLPGMEIYRRLPSEMGWETFDLDCSIPVVAL